MCTFLILHFLFQPFYVLGVNIALQVGSELKTILAKDELEIAVKGFSDSLLGLAGDEKELLSKYGPSNIYLIRELLTQTS